MTSPGDKGIPKFHSILEERCEKFLSSLYFTDTNLHGIQWNWSRPVDSISTWKVPENWPTVDSESAKVFRPGGQRILFQDLPPESKFQQAKLGDTFGPSWSTYWFIIRGTIPKSGNPIYFRWNSSSEAMVYEESGTPIQGLTGGQGCDKRHDVKLAGDKQSFKFFVEMACNEMFGVGREGLVNPPDPQRTFQLCKCDIAEMDIEANSLYWDYKVLFDLVKYLPQGSSDVHGIRLQMLMACNEIVNTFHQENRSSWKECKRLTTELLRGVRIEIPRGTNMFRPVSKVYAVGHCHIDTAWLWPYDETKRKVLRSWKTMVRYMDDHPHFIFGASQAQQFEWLYNLSPQAFQNVKDKVTQGRFSCLGGTWVEMDAYIPSGESLCRQFLHGRRFFYYHFGNRGHSEIFWLPDTFGYCPQLPQLIRQAEMKYFLTQKLSWNLVNKFPHSSFWWEGLDGSQVLAHFPPADTYNAQANVEDVLSSVSQNKDKDRAPISMMLYGNGDGGGGPTLEMLEQLNRITCSNEEASSDDHVIRNLPGLPEVQHSHPHNFFADLLEFDKHRRFEVWRGELYLELHQGTLTSQAALKKGNRHGESLLYQLETADTMMGLESWSFGRPTKSRRTESNSEGEATQITSMWKKLLLNQFHDVLPGTSIPSVSREAEQFFIDIQTEGRQLLCKILNISLQITDRYENCIRIYNLLPFPFPKLICNKGNSQRIQPPKTGEYGRGLESGLAANLGPSECMDAPLVSIADPCFILLRPTGISKVAASVQEFTSSQRGNGLKSTCALKSLESSIVLSNNIVEVAIDKHTGAITSYCDCTCDPPVQLIKDGATSNRFSIHPDVPFFWDAWDLMEYHNQSKCDIHTGVWSPGSGTHTGTKPSVQVSPVDITPFVVSVCVSLGDFGPNKASSIVQCLRLYLGSSSLECETQVNWHESHKVLKVNFPFAFRSENTLFDTQFGLHSRPQHANTSTDAMKYEVCAHRFAAIQEGNAVVAIINDSKYGYSCRDSNMSLTLLRSPKAPDDTCDQGYHHFTYSMMASSPTIEEKRRNIFGEELGLRGLPHREPLQAIVEEAAILNTPAIQATSQHNQLYEHSSCHTSSFYLDVDIPSAARGAQLSCLKPLSEANIQQLQTSNKNTYQKHDGCIVRVFEGIGSRGWCALRFSKRIASVSRLNILENPVDGTDGEPKIVNTPFTMSFDDSIKMQSGIHLYLHPFQIVTLQVLFGNSN